MNSAALVSFRYMPYFIQKAVIKGIQPLYNNEVYGIIWNLDLSVLLEIHKKDGSTYEYQLNIRCNFKRDHTDRIIGWGSAFKLQKLFQSLNVTGIILSDGTISQQSLDQLIGKEVFVLSYISGLKDDGSHRFQMWDLLSADRTSLEEDFKYSNERGYPRNYHPELILETIGQEQERGTVLSTGNEPEDDGFYM